MGSFLGLANPSCEFRIENSDENTEDATIKGHSLIIKVKDRAELLSLIGYEGQVVTQIDIALSYEWDSSVDINDDNGGTIIHVSSAGGWRAKYSGAVNVKWFTNDDGTSVKGDGVNDDTTGIQKAFDYACRELDSGSYSADEIRDIKTGTGIFKIEKLYLKHRGTVGDYKRWNIDFSGSKIIQDTEETSAVMEILSCKNVSFIGLNIASGVMNIQGIWNCSFYDSKVVATSIGFNDYGGSNLFRSNYWNTFTNCRLGNIKFNIHDDNGNKEFNSNTFTQCISDSIEITGNNGGSFQGNTWVGGELRGDPAISIDEASPSDTNGLSVISAYMDSNGEQTDLFNFRLSMSGLCNFSNGYMLDSQSIDGNGSRLDTSGISGVRTGSRLPVSATNLVLSGDLSDLKVGETFAKSVDAQHISIYNCSSEILNENGTKFIRVTTEDTYSNVKMRTGKVEIGGTYTFTIIYRRPTASNEFSLRLENDSGSIKDYNVFSSQSTKRDEWVISSYTTVITADDNYSILMYNGSSETTGHIDIMYAGASLGSQGLINSPSKNTTRTESYRDSLPTSGSWEASDIIYNTSPIAGGNVGWIYTTAGVWKTFGTIEA